MHFFACKCAGELKYEYRLSLIQVLVFCLIKDMRFNNEWILVLSPIIKELNLKKGFLKLWKWFKKHVVEHKINQRADIQWFMYGCVVVVWKQIFLKVSFCEVLFRGL